ncbi:hypothetical protein K2173_014283 [Erythroxylum novogranatense]|uniref:Uncharacterized protein n=1 Tax=Erythroxylum novogranatense TaxID=1862640 RepID=A0AAV8SE94_9ROSI|nr:hypothetical protein K2173_014283 [Erythroxylum novogranatense]
MADEEHFNLVRDISIVIPPNKEEDEVRINADSMAASFENMMSQKLTMSDKCCIFRIPYILQRHNEKAYIPNAFAIGPWHHNTEKLKPTEKIKLKYLRGLLSRSPCRETRLKEFINTIAGVEKEAREYYAGPIDVNVDKFVQILVLDGCFLIELFRKDDDEKLRDSDDPIFNMSCMLQYLYHDLILLENQIPWMVLERLFNMTTRPGSKPLVELALKFFSNIFSSTPPPSVQDHKGHKHMLDLLRAWLVLSSGKEEDVKPGWQSMPSATNLLDAGIKFSPGNSKSILDIKFTDGVLEIPPLLIQETTEVIIRNLISYEQCTPNCSARITSYAILLDNLINTTRDMDILSQNGIIDNWLNPEDATQFFNKLYHDAYVKRYYYLDLCAEVNKYCERRCPKWRAMFMRNYFGTPWAIASLSAASTLLILTIVQTVFSILK